MSEYKKITDDISVYGQISTEDLQLAQQQGFKTIVNNRPDNEAADQISSAELEKVATELGLSYIYLPIVPAGISDAEVEQFALLAEKTPKPILAFCRTGNRSTRLWALSQGNRNNSEVLVQQAHQAGYDISNLLDRLNANR